MLVGTDELKSLEERVNERIDSLVIQLATNISYINTAVGFNARLSSSSIRAHTPIKYTNVVANKGGRYSRYTGKFTADRPGLYYFEQYWVTAEGNNHYYQSLYIYKNGNTLLCESYGNPAGRSNNYGDMNAPSCSAVVELQVRDQVYVMTRWGEDYVASDKGYNFGCDSCTGFNGFLIRSYV